LLRNALKSVIDIFAHADIMISMDKTAKTYKALSDKTRLRILNLLTGGELCVCAIMRALGLPQSTVSRHLAYLKNTDWLNHCRKGVWMYYSINASPDALRLLLLEGIKAHFASISEGISDKARLFEYLKHDPCK
jgi:ArsR family transcriptional regulator, arsenate/arsenite/antimonite-responsive transcriptional repressor